MSTAKKSVKTVKQVKLPLSDNDKKVILDVVLSTPNINFEEAKVKYANALRVYIEQIEQCGDLVAFKKINKTEPKFIMFDYDKAIEQLLNQNVTITKKDLKKYVQLL